MWHQALHRHLGVAFCAEDQHLVHHQTVFGEDRTQMHTANSMCMDAAVAAPRPGAERLIMHADTMHNLFLPVAYHARPPRTQKLH